MWKLQKVILNTLDFEHVTQTICDALLKELGYSSFGYKIVVLSLINENKSTLERVAVSQTAEAKHALSLLPLPFTEIEIPLSDDNNVLIKTIKSGSPQITHNWYDLMRPAISRTDAESMQKKVGIMTSFVYPIKVSEKTIGAMIFSLSKDLRNFQGAEIELLGGFVDIIGLSVQNATLYKKLELSSTKLKKANERLLELDKLKDEFVSLASHELRTPMVSIRNYIWMVLNGKGGTVNPKQREYLHRAYDSTSRLSRLVNSMLNLSRIESGRVILSVEKADIRTVIHDVITEIGMRADKLKIKLALRKKVVSRTTGEVAALPTVVIDIDKIKEVLINLIGNSLKFTPTGGSITITLAVDKEHVTVGITDTGVGLTVDQIPKLFKKFSMLRESYSDNATLAQGTGLGLYIAKSIIELHQGTVWVESAGRGKGSSFYFTIPRYTEAHLQLLRRNQHNGKDVGIIHSAMMDY